MIISNILIYNITNILNQRHSITSSQGNPEYVIINTMRRYIINNSAHIHYN